MFLRVGHMQVPCDPTTLLDKILIANRISPDLIKLYTKAEFE
jgi:hypothetical protein